MLSVIIDVGDSTDRLPGLLAQLTSAAVEGLVREVLIAGGAPAELLAVLREETGAELVSDLGEGVRQARSETLLVLPGSIRLRPAWIEGLAAHLRDGGRAAVLAGEGGGLLRGAPYGVLIAKARAASAHPDLKRLRRELGPAARRRI